METANKINSFHFKKTYTTIMAVPFLTTALGIWAIMTGLGIIGYCVRMVSSEQQKITKNQKIGVCFVVIPIGIAIVVGGVINTINGVTNDVDKIKNTGNKINLSGGCSINIYTLEGCGWCKKATDKLKAAKLSYKEIEYQRESANEGKEQPNGEMASTFPQIWVNGKPVGGYSDMDKWIGSCKQ